MVLLFCRVIPVGSNDDARTVSENVSANIASSKTIEKLISCGRVSSGMN